jgi:DNA-binding NarL/FixJ family response regulator
LAQGNRRSEILSSKPGGEQIRVIIADDYPIMRDGIKEALCRRPDILSVAEARNSAETLRLTREWQPDVLVLDVQMPDMSAVEVVRRLQAVPPAPQILVLAPCDQINQALAVVEAGVCGFLLKNSEPALIGEGVRAVFQGQRFFSPIVAEYLVKQSLQRRLPANDLTGREKQILQLMSEGWSNLEIAAGLNLSEQTIKNHVCRIYRKLGAGSRVEAVMLAVKQGWVDN